MHLHDFVTAYVSIFIPNQLQSLSGDLSRSRDVHMCLDLLSTYMCAIYNAVSLTATICIVLPTAKRS